MNEPTERGSTMTAGRRAACFDGQVCVGAYDQPLEDFLSRSLQPHGLRWSQNVLDGVVRMADGSSIIFAGSAHPGMPCGFCYEPDIFRRGPGERGFVRVPLRHGSYRTGSIGSGVIKDGKVSYSRAAGVQMPAFGAEAFELQMSPSELVFRQGDVIDVRCPKLGLTWEYFVPASHFYCQESIWEAHGTVLGQEIEYGWIYNGAYFTKFDEGMWQAFGAFAGFRGALGDPDYCLAYGMNTYSTGEVELLFALTGTGQTHCVAVQTSPRPGAPFTLTSVERDVTFSTTRDSDCAKLARFTTPGGVWEFVIAAEDSPESMWSWATGRRVGDTRKLTASAGWVDHIFHSLGEVKGNTNVFGLRAGEFRGRKGHAPA